ncbi:hypothetical protein HDU92_003919 [Lobulomyces angularis]|nr:hypothetical protein HDU92_003919 [Lobulomyces angularis]
MSGIKNDFSCEKGFLKNKNRKTDIETKNTSKNEGVSRKKIHKKSLATRVMDNFNSDIITGNRLTLKHDKGKIGIFNNGKKSCSFNASGNHGEIDEKNSWEKKKIKTQKIPTRSSYFMEANKESLTRATDQVEHKKKLNSSISSKKSHSVASTLEISSQSDDSLNKPVNISIKRINKKVSPEQIEDAHKNALKIAIPPINSKRKKKEEVTDACDSVKKSKIMDSTFSQKKLETQLGELNSMGAREELDCDNSVVANVVESQFEFKNIDNSVEKLESEGGRNANFSSPLIFAQKSEINSELEQITNKQENFNSTYDTEEQKINNLLDKEIIKFTELSELNNEVEDFDQFNDEEFWELVIQQHKNDVERKSFLTNVNNDASQYSLNEPMNNSQNLQNNASVGNETMNQDTLMIPSDILSGEYQNTFQCNNTKPYIPNNISEENQLIHRQHLLPNSSCVKNFSYNFPLEDVDESITSGEFLSPHIGVDARVIVAKDEDLSSILELIMDFQDLYNSSQSLTSHIVSTNFPSIDRGIDQIEQQSRKLFSKTTREGSRNIDTRTAYLLANKGYDAEKVAETLEQIDFAGTFESLNPIQDTDVESYLQHQHEIIVLSAVEDGRKQCVDDFEINFEKNLTRDWEISRKRIFEELGQRKALKRASPRTSHEFFRQSRHQYTYLPKTTLNPKMKNFSKVVMSLNDARLKEEDFGLIASFTKVVKQNEKGGDVTEKQLSDCWKLLSNILMEKNVENGVFKRNSLSALHYKELFDSQIQDNKFTVNNFQKIIVEGGKEFLSQHFWQFMEDSISHNRSATLGMPSVNTVVDAFVKLKFTKYGNFTKSYIEVYDIGDSKKAIWVHLFYLVRANRTNEAVSYIEEHHSYFSSSDSNFSNYFKTWVSGGLDKQLRNMLLQHWNNYIKDSLKVGNRGIIEGDPFKYALYKLIGRCELNRKVVPGNDVLPSTQDYLWFQLMLIQEGTKSEESTQDRFTLRDMAKSMKRFGCEHFCPHGKQLTNWAFVLFICGEFEQAIDFLFSIPDLQVDAVHFGIALAYYGVLRIFESPHLGNAGIKVLDYKTISTPAGEYQISSINFSNILESYSKSFSTSSTVEALHYVFVIGLFGSEIEDVDSQFFSNQKKPGAQEYTNILHQFIVDIILENLDKIDLLLGSVRDDCVRLPGFLEKYMKLLHIKSTEAFLNIITKTAATKCDERGNYDDTIVLYDLAGEYDEVFSILNKRLGEKISQRTYVGPLQPAPVSFKLQDQKISLIATEILDKYENHAQIFNKVKRSKLDGCKILISLMEFFNLIDQKKYKESITITDTLKIFPTIEDPKLAKKKALDLEILDENVLKVLDGVLIFLMYSYRQLNNSFKRFGNFEELHEINTRMKALILFCSNVRYKLPQDVYGQLVKLHNGEVV